MSVDPGHVTTKDGVRVAVSGSQLGDRATLSIEGVVGLSFDRLQAERLAALLAIVRAHVWGDG